MYGSELMGKFLSIISMVIFISGCISQEGQLNRTSEELTKSELTTYTLDLSEILDKTYPGYELEGPLGIAHNAVAAFPLNLDVQTKILEETSPNTIIEVQTLESCTDIGSIVASEEMIKNADFFGPPQTEEQDKLRRLNNIVRYVSNIKIKDIADIRKINLTIITKEGLDLDEDGTIRDDYNDRQEFCIGYHTSDKKWFWDFAPIQPKIDNKLKKGFAEINLKGKNVDSIAILSNSGTIIEKITFEAAKE